MLEVKDLLCEYTENPLGVDNPEPGFSWLLKSDDFGVCQKYYRIQVSDQGDDFEGRLFYDSGKVVSADSVDVKYGGPPLEANTRYYYRICVGTEVERAFSEPAYFQTGLFSAENWKADWISPPFAEKRKQPKPVYYFKHDFNCRGGAERAVVYASAQGVYEIRINGRRISDNMFAPGFTSYKNRIQYQSYDVGPFLKPGENEVTVLLGDGWFRGPFTFMNFRNLWGKKTSLLFQMHISYPGGDEQLVTSSGDWIVSDRGPVRRSEFYYGEDYDARLEAELESGTLFELSKGAALADEKDGIGYNLLCENRGDPVKVIDQIVPERIFRTPKGETVFDLGQNISGIVKLRLRNTAPGQLVRVSHAEILDDDGNFYTANLRKARASIEYTCRGAESEEYTPVFTYMGFRYVRLEGYENAEPGTVTGLVVSTEMKQTGRFECSDPMLNRLYRNILWGQRANFIDIPTDCPQRDERMGYTGDAQIFAATACYNMRGIRFFRKWLEDLRLDQGRSGIVDMTVPREIRIPFFRMKSAGWGDAAVIVPWLLNRFYGDKEILRSSYESMKKWVEYSGRRAARRKPRYIWDNDGHLGDWLAPGEDKPQWIAKKPWVATAYFAHSADLLARTAEILGRTADAERFSRLFNDIRNAFCDQFVEEDGHIRDGFQTAYALALRFNLLPPELRARAAGYLAEDVRNNGNKLTTGFLGTPHLCFALSDNGHEEAALDLLFQKDCPSWLYPVTMGATTMWERWDGIRPDGSINETKQGGDNMVSFNHYAYGAIGEWLYSRLGGLSADEKVPGFRRFVYSPLITSRLKYVKTGFESLYGRIQTAWEAEDGRVRLELSAPPGTSVELRLKAAVQSSVQVNTKPLESFPYADGIRQNGNRLIFNLPSGEYGIEYEEYAE